MAEIIPVPRKIQFEDFIPNYDYQLKDVDINEEEASKQKIYLQMFMKENFGILESQTQSMNITQLDAYVKGAKDMMAFVNLWIDSLNATSEDTEE